ncbi:MAG: insulinase family protein [Blautia sp.]|nr:insulinase family protein [Blautia sp.]
MNKSLLTMLIALTLLAGCIPTAGAESASSAAPAARPQTGDVVEGFEVIEERDYPLMDAVIYRFEHQKTGAELYYIANDDTNRAFDLNFLTAPIDNTGLPHVFEHATIQGSRKYPGEQMYFNLNYQTYNTFLNAMTGQYLTSYPIASLSEEQLLKLAEFYTDACFYPIIMENENIFRTEAWRYRLENEEAPLTIEGTVYSEMLGSMTLQRQAIMNLMRAAFPGSIAGNDSGGDPDCIPDMTWQALKDYHDRYYHPSNCVGYLYGQFADYTAFLQLLDGYFSAYEKQEINHDDTGYTPITEPVVLSCPFPVETGANTEHTSMTIYCFVCPGLRQETEQKLALNTMTELFNDNASDLQQRLREAIPYGSFSVSIQVDAPDDSILFSAINVDPDDAETFRVIVNEELAKIAKDGFPQELVDSVSTSLKISAKLIRESSDPVNTLFIPMVSNYATSGNPWYHLDYQDSLFRMDAWNRQGMYAHAVTDWLLNSQITVLATTYPEPGAKEIHDAELTERLATIKAAMTEEEIADIVEAANTTAPEDKSAEYVAQLKAVTVESLPEDIKLYNVTDMTDPEGIRHIDAQAAVDGISLTSLLLDAAGLSQEDVPWFSLYTDLLGELDTKSHTRAELASLRSRYLYSGDILSSLAKVGKDGYHPYLSMIWIALDEDLATGYDLMHELIFDTKVDNPSKLLEQVQSLKASLKSNVTADPANALLRLALARTDEKYAYSSYTSGVEYYEFLGEVELLLKDNPDVVTAKLQDIQAYFNNSTNAVTVCAGNEASIALNRQLSDSFLALLDRREIEPAKYRFPIPSRREALIIDSSIQFNMVADTLDSIGLDDFNGGMDAECSLVTDTFLVPMLRDQYGVYTPITQINEDFFLLYAYRDPNIAETYDMLEQLPELIADLELDQETLDGYIMKAYSEYAMPPGELSGAASAADDVLAGLDPARSLVWMRQLKQLTPENVRASADLYAKLLENGARMTAGAASAINQNADLFDTILNPFGAVDNTQVELTDVPEYSEHYEAVRFVFEQGLMDPRAEDTFGVNEPASHGDLYTAVYVMMGGGKDEAEALAALSEYGLADPSAELSASLLPGEVWDLFSALTGQKLEPLTQTASPDIVTRAELAEMLKALMEMAG